MESGHFVLTSFSDTQYGVGRTLTDDSIIKSLVKEQPQYSFNEYICNMQTNMKQNPNLFWSYINSKRNASYSRK